MKKLTIAIQVLLFYSIIALGQQKGVWDFPIKPGTEDWMAFRTNQEMWDACQIPKDILTNLTTDELAKLCLKYPLRGDYVFYNNERNGIKEVISRFNGFVELSKRTNGARAIIDIYKDYPVLNKMPTKESVDYLVPYNIMFYELLIADSVFINQLDINDLNNLMTIVKGKYTDKLESRNVYTINNIKKTMLLATVILIKSNPSYLK